MFTGIIESVGCIEQIQNKQKDKSITIDVGTLSMADISIGDSIVCNGVCLTVIEQSKTTYTADVSLESLHLTTLQHFKKGTLVNLEKAMLASTRFGGHLVSGHVDGIGTIVLLKKEARSLQMTIQVPEAFAHYIAKKGSICVDGVSLTVNEITKNERNVTYFVLNLVPHTFNVTIAKHYRVGTLVNIEVDLMARYLERLLTHSS
jgi:riboflavin synthase